MTGRGHRLTGVGAAFFAAACARLAGWDAHAELAAATIALFSTNLPDQLEFPQRRNGVRVGTLITHRTVTHWGLFWLLALGWGLYEGTLFAAMVSGAAVGALFHLLGDAPNPMGVPWLWPTRRLRIGKRGLWRSGQNELLLILFFTLLGVGAWHFAVFYTTGASFPFALPLPTMLDEISSFWYNIGFN